MEKIVDINSVKNKVKSRTAEEQKKHDTTKGHEPAKDSYFIKNGYWCRSKETKDGPIAIRLANFTANIAEENLVDDGKDQLLFFTIEGKLAGERSFPKIEIPAANFQNLSWLSRWGAGPILEPGQTVKDFVRHAIQVSSLNVKSTAYYAHTGWRQIDGEWSYLHAGGAIGEKEIEIKLSKELTKYFLPPLSSINLATQKEAAAASLSFLDVGDHNITIPLFAMIFLAPLTTLLSPMPNFSGYLYGPSGSFKTSLALLGLSHFGSFNGVEGLSSFDDSVGILEKRSFTLKDTLHVVDDYHPSGHRQNQQARENILQHLIRGYSNRTARGRLNSDLTERGRYEPRGFLLVTAEDLPGLESTLARTCVIEFGDNSIDKIKLAALQAKADILPLAMVDYISWVRENMESIKSIFPNRFIELRQLAALNGLHRKLPEQAAFLGFALETVTSFFRDRGIMTDAALKALVAEGWDVFQSLADLQQRRIAADDPVNLFIDIIITLLHQRRARLDSKTGGGDIGADERIGFYDDQNLFLLPIATWHAIQRFCIQENTYFPFSKNTFFQMLRNRKILMPSPSGENTMLIKIEGKPVRVLKIIDRGIYEKAVTSVTGVTD